MQTLDSVRKAGQRLVLFLLSMPFCLDARGILVTRLGYKRGTTPSLERDHAQESSFFPLAVFFHLQSCNLNSSRSCLYL